MPNSENYTDMSKAIAEISRVSNPNFNEKQKPSELLKSLRIRISLLMGKIYSKARLAKDLDLSPHIVYSWERGSTWPNCENIEKIRKLANQYGVELDFDNLLYDKLDKEFGMSSCNPNCNDIYNETFERIAEKIKNLRKKIGKTVGKNYSQRALSKDLNIDQATIYRWECSISVPRLSNINKLKKIAQKYGVEFI